MDCKKASKREDKSSSSSEFDNVFDMSYTVTSRRSQRIKGLINILTTMEKIDSVEKKIESFDERLGKLE